MDAQQEIRSSDVAVVGLACRFPGSPTAERFWENLEAGADTVTIFSDEELLAEGVAPELLRDPQYVKAGQILPGVDLFDADLFKITSDEAEILDPQQRFFLECAVEALENAGYDPAGFAGAIGVYAGVGMNTYLLRNLGERYRAASPMDRYRLMLAGDKDYLTTRLSYKMNLRGPSVTVNTACSTSLVAVHMACLGLQSGECDMALAGAAHIRIPQIEGYLFQPGMIFSPDGHCRAFDANAQGTVLGNGVGVVVLRRLEDAIADGDWVHAVIKGSAVNNDGARKASYTAPSVEGQAAAIREALALAGCDPSTISHVEAHGTGTPLGDPVEFAALLRAFGAIAGRGRCALGSVKTNVGHLDVAAGMAGLIKTILMLQRKRLVPSLYFETPNPEIAIEGSPFYVNTTAKEWSANGAPRRAGVSSFGIGGTNAHVVLEEPAARQPRPSARSRHLLLLSARSAPALRKTAQELSRRLKYDETLELADVAYTLAVGRRHYPHRLALVCSDKRDAAFALALGDRERLLSGHAEREPRQAAFVFRDGISTAAQCELASVLISWGVPLGACAGSGSGAVAAGALAGCFPHAAAPDLSHPSFSPPRIPLWTDAAGWMSPERAVDPATWTVRSPSDVPTPALNEYVPVEIDPEAGPESLLSAVARLWVGGADLDWPAFYRGERRRRTPLPARPFEPKRHWIDHPERPQAAILRVQPRLREQIESAPDPIRAQIVVAFIQREIARILGSDDDVPEATANLFDLGIDSLILIEVAATLSTELGGPVLPAAFVDHFTIRSFSEHLLVTMGYERGARGAASARVSVVS